MTIDYECCMEENGKLYKDEIEKMQNKIPPAIMFLVNGPKRQTNTLHCRDITNPTFSLFLQCSFIGD